MKKVIQTIGSEGGKSFSLKRILETYFIYKLHLTQLPLQNISLLHLALPLPSALPQSIVHHLLPKSATLNSALQSILSLIHFHNCARPTLKNSLPLSLLLFESCPCPKKESYHRATPGCRKKCPSIRAKSKDSIPCSTSYQQSEFTVLCCLMIELHSEPCIIKQSQHHVNTTH